jgi:hypothetical protein
MLERVCVPALEPEQIQFDLGVLAESLIFYGEVHIVLTHSSLKGLLAQLGPELLIELAVEKYLHVSYIDHGFIIFTANKGTPRERHDAGFAHPRHNDVASVAQEEFIRVIGKQGRGRRLANKFSNAVGTVAYPTTIPTSVTRDMQEGIYLEAYVRRRLARANPSISESLLREISYRYSLVPGEGYRLETNVNLQELRTKGIDVSDIADQASVLAHYGTIVADTSIWAGLQTEVAVTTRQEDALTSRVDSLLQRSSNSQDQLEAFQAFVFDDGRALREAINWNPSEFRSLLPVADKARRFRKWLANQPPEVDLVKAYYKEVVADSWIDRLPGKSSRWSLFTAAGIGIDLLGAGGVGTVGAAALSAFDSFLLDRLVKGWKPNQFVEGPLRKFVYSRSKS